ncbi:MAG: trypsin-like peptidase domain-containing protein [Flavobacteriales bacterium]|nr:trypsin-like peptidase domain-containing protein [Flavobacteriales bacterium]
MKNLISGFLMALLGATVSLGIYKYIEPKIVILPNEKEQAKATSVNYVRAEPTLGVDYTTAAELTVNGVVHVKTEGTVEYNQRGFDPFKELLYGNGNYNQKYIQPVKGAGSGVIISPDGYIVTNNHVIEKADQIKITLNNKKTYDAKVIGTDPTTDLALLKIEEDGLPYVSYGNSDQIRVGEWVLAVGNPFNLTSTVTAGIVSAKGRDIDILSNDPFTGNSSIESFIQTDAAVNPGNSGGALVNTKGELIGINAAIKSNTGSFTGYSFAIPSNIVKKVVRDLKEFGNVQRAFIGVQIRNIDEELAKENNIDDFNGIYVTELIENGSAKEAGIIKGDIIKEVEGVKVNSATELQAKVGEYRPGDRISIKLVRNGKSIEKEVLLKNMEGNTAIISNSDNQLMKALGAKFSELDDELKDALDLDGGAQVESLFSGKFKNAGIKEGFIITKVDKTSIKNPEILLNLLSQKKDEGILIQGLYPNGQEAYYGVGM